MRTGAIIQARLSSTRLPRKVLKKLPYDSDVTAIEQLICRVKDSKFINDIVLATSTQKEDEELIEIAKKNGIKYFRGSIDNVLSRFYQVASKEKFDVVVRLTGDCPCLHPAIIDNALDSHFQHQADFSSTAIERTWPHGLDLGIMNFNVLEEAYENAIHDYEKEHVTTYIYKSHPDKFRINIVKAPPPYNRPDIRITLDTIEDYTLLCAVFDYLHRDIGFFTIDDILSLLEDKPWLLNINSGVIQKKVHPDLKSELDELIEYSRHQGLDRVVELLAKTRKK